MSDDWVTYPRARLYHTILSRLILKRKMNRSDKTKQLYFLRFVYLIFGGFDETMSTRLAEICHRASLTSLLHPIKSVKGTRNVFFLTLVSPQYKQTRMSTNTPGTSENWSVYCRMKLEISQVPFLDSFLQILLIYYSYGHTFTM